jgi:hypothetical protein
MCKTAAHITVRWSETACRECGAALPVRSTPYPRRRMRELFEQRHATDYPVERGCEVAAAFRQKPELAISRRQAAALFAERLLDLERFLVPLLGGGELAAMLCHPTQLVVDRGQTGAVAERLEGRERLPVTIVRRRRDRCEAAPLCTSGSICPSRARG